MQSELKPKTTETVIADTDTINTYLLKQIARLFPFRARAPKPAYGRGRFLLCLGQYLIAV